MARQDEDILDIDIPTSEKYLLSCPPLTYLFRRVKYPAQLGLSYVSYDGSIYHSDFPTYEKNTILLERNIPRTGKFNDPYITLYRALHANEVSSLSISRIGRRLEFVKAPLPHSPLDGLLSTLFFPLPSSPSSLSLSNTYLYFLPRDIIRLLECFWKSLQPLHAFFSGSVDSSKLLQLSRVFGDRLEAISLHGTLFENLSCKTPGSAESSFLEEFYRLPRLESFDISLHPQFSPFLLKFFQTTKAPLKRISLSFSRKIDPHDALMLMEGIAGNSAFSLSAFTVMTRYWNDGWFLKPLLEKGLEEIGGDSIFSLQEICASLQANCPLKIINIDSFDMRDDNLLLDALKNNTHLTELCLSFSFKISGNALAHLLSLNQSLRILRISVVNPGIAAFVDVLSHSSLHFFITSNASITSIERASKGTIKFDACHSYSPGGL